MIFIARFKLNARKANDISAITLEKGIEKGKIEIAKNLLKMGISIEQISEATGLTKEEIEKYKKNN